MSSWFDMLERAADRQFRTFGEPAVYTPDVGDPLAVTVIRRQPSAEVPFGTAGFQGIAWEADVRASEISTPVAGATLTIGAESFTVAGVPRQDATARIFTLPLRLIPGS